MSASELGGYDHSATSGDDLESKHEALRALLREMAPVLVAFSGGVDSTLLLDVALEVLGAEAVLAVTAHGDVHTEQELSAARATAARMGVRHEIVQTHELLIPGFAANPPDRCYHCKRSLYEDLLRLALDRGMKTVVDGANADDMNDYRPGTEAARELGVRSPLAEAGLSKADIRALARSRGLSEWDRPASPCLASRFPYGETIDAKSLRMVEEAERYLRDLGIQTLRVRHHGDMARIEVAPEDMTCLFGAGVAADDSAVESAGAPGGAGLSVRRGIVEHLRGLDYRWVTLDLEGFRSGSLNEVLSSEAARVEEQ